MAIKLVVNGYFRSGTTFVWDFMKEALREEGYLSLYEPLNPDMAILINKERDNRINVLHDRFVYKEYLEIDERTLARLLRNNPNANGFGIENDAALIAYLDIFHGMERKLFLQPNRLHFHLDLLFERYGANVVHVIRHPLDVYLSIAKGAYVLVESRFKRALHALARPFLLVRSFEIEKQYRWINYKAGYPAGYRDSIRLRLLNRFDAFEKFVVVWTVSNYCALKSIQAHGGMLLVYEQLLGDPERALQRLNGYTGTEVREIPAVRRDNFYKFDAKMLEKFHQTVAKYSLGREFDFILDAVQKEGFAWKL